MREGTWLGFDFGMRRIGVAAGQSVTRSAAPLTTLKAVKGKPNWDEVRALVKHWGACGLVVGIPYNMDASNQPITHFAEVFAAELQRETNLPIHLIDERLTTVAAREFVYENRGHSKRKAYEPVDDFSAALILEAFFAGK